MMNFEDLTPPPPNQNWKSSLRTLDLRNSPGPITVLGGHLEPQAWGVSLFPLLHIQNTRMHSSRMRTGRPLTVSRSLLPGGGSGPGGLVQGVGVWSWGCLLWGCLVQGVWSREGVCSGGGLLWGGGCLLWGGLVRGAVVVVSQHALRQTPPCRQNHRCL